MMDTAPAAIGHNLPPVSDQLADYYADAALLERNGALVRDVEKLEGECAKLEDVQDDTANESAARIVRLIRDMVKRIDDAKEAEKRPLIVASRACDGFTKLLNDPKSGTSLAAHKARIERLIGGHAQRKAEAERQRRLEAEARLKAEADAAAAKAAEAEAAGQGKLAEVMMGQAVKREALAEAYGEVAAGPITDLARTQTAEGTTGLRSSWTFEIVNPADLKATLGPLRDCFTVDAVEAALRKFIRAEVDAGRDPVLPGVRFAKELKGNVR